MKRRLESQCEIWYDIGMAREWFLYIHDQEEGPYRIEEVFSDSRVSEQTLLWREGMKDWTPLKEVSGLAQKLRAWRKEQNRKKRAPKRKAKEPKRIKLPEDEVIAIRSDPPPYWMLLLLVLILLIYYLFFR